MAPEKTPGTDGLPCEFYKVFWNDFAEILVNALNHSFETGMLSISQRRGIVKLIPKKDADLKLIKNWRPITLLNCDYKIATKAIASRIKTLLPNLISDDQTGFIKDRFIGENIRLIDSVMKFTASRNIPGLLLFLDFEKAFDTLEWAFIHKTLRYFNFGPSLIKWIKVFYCNIESCILNNGWTSNFFQLSRGVRQGCPLSPYIFILSVEVMAEAIRRRKEIVGIIVNGKEIKLSQYADDTTLILDGSEQSVKEAVKLLESFGDASGLRLNSSKTEALWIGSKANCDLKLCPEKDFKWPKKKVKALGVWLSTDPDITISQNYKDKLERIKATLGCWKFRRLSLLGKVLILKSLITSQLVYILSPLQSSPEAIKEINSIFYNFLWNGKGDKIKRNVMINDYSQGGLKMIDILSFNKSLKATWIKKYLDTENGGSWKLFFDAELQRYGGKLAILGNLNSKDMHSVIKVSDPFVKESLEIWSEISFEETVTSYKHLCSAPLWHNSLIRIGNKPVFYQDWFLKGISKVNHLMDDSLNFLSHISFQNKYNLRVKPLTFFGMIAAINHLRIQIARNQPDSHESFSSVFMKSTKPSRLVYKKLLSKRGQEPISSQQKWQQDIDTDQKVNWKAVYQLASHCTKSSKLIVFNFKFLHRRLSTNSFLHKLGFTDSEKCTFCLKETEHLLHLFWTCEKTQSFWNSLFSWLQSGRIIEKDSRSLEADAALGLRPDNSKYELQINFCFLIAKYFIWICKLKECIPKLNDFLSYLRHFFKIENDGRTVAKKWEALLPILQ